MAKVLQSLEMEIDYKCQDRIISVSQVYQPSPDTKSRPLYRLLHVKYMKQQISILLLQSLMKQAVQNVILSPQSYEKKDHDSHALSSSPICVTTFPEESHLFDQLYDRTVILALKEIFFKCDTEELLQSICATHTPLLISIEGNIGAGKSKFTLILFHLMSHLFLSNTLEQTQRISS
jgi:hypothetical protein